MGMMQGQQPTSPQEAQQTQLAEDEAAMLQDFEPFTDEDFQQMGMTPGNSPEAVKARIVELLERLGFMKDLKAGDKMELFQEVDKFVQALISGDQATADQSPINDMLGSFDESMGQMDDMESELMTAEEEINAMEGGMPDANE